MVCQNKCFHHGSRSTNALPAFRTENSIVFDNANLKHRPIRSNPIQSFRGFYPDKRNTVWCPYRLIGFCLYIERPFQETGL